ncbi:SDR family NAD(P)-dependent oxidoreductase [Carboxylicivirga mesophila]|uniref:SDR family NAD(P)-dependent oxidoreductase n=1 Tax=Carboxylicivirga mesophila TaxID=1166478 RepID=A0ABS5KCJ3_9BACT|nr:SDR family NAD(P)-dependent oxidoreductase [Carboxylicivirga mesophila]MBS2212706.1 SDR family NAD(P)-dependent oxidoreductase [Carboxylicivirga mesophila]
MKLIDIIPVVRMLLSDDGLVCCKTEAKTDVSDSETACISIDQSGDKASLITALQAQLSQAAQPVKTVLVKGKGRISIDAPRDEAGFNEIIKNRIVIITGGAQGFGGGVAEELFAKGAHIVVTDLNEEAGDAMVSKLNARGQSNKALYVKVNVSDPHSVKEMIDQTVMALGGIDVIISNAGILRAGGLDEMTPETFELMTKVNYSGYFYCAKHASHVMKLQASVAPHHFMDIIQINSKSGLKGSNRNFAYAGGKFGGIGLTQSFALELMPYNIKVNSICPGNFFDGPLWSDPENGLFIQYLKAGKVPGAKTIEDVQAHYEMQVPAKRGCRVGDVTKAILYAIDQLYETGQAIPVTGGQEMLK